MIDFLSLDRVVNIYPPEPGFGPTGLPIPPGQQYSNQGAGAGMPSDLVGGPTDPLDLSGGGGGGGGGGIPIPGGSSAAPAAAGATGQQSGIASALGLGTTKGDVSAALGLGGIALNLYNGKAARNAAKQAAQFQMNAINQAQGSLNSLYQGGMQGLSPYTNAGAQATSNMMSRLYGNPQTGFPGTQNMNPGAAALMNVPGVGYNLNSLKAGNMPLAPGAQSGAQPQGSMAGSPGMAATGGYGPGGPMANPQNVVQVRLPSGQVQAMPPQQAQQLISQGVGQLVRIGV